MSVPYDLSAAIEKAQAARPMRTGRRSRHNFQRVSLLRPRWENCAVIASVAGFWLIVGMAFIK
ncbi:MAG: hypothetical protein JO111_03725 [Caulobacteraceae bacterium]|nr:hypothetical protein [Caulobacteraceae bacterium]